MSAAQAVTAKLLTLLQEDLALMRAVHGVYDRPTSRASLPMVMIGAVSASDWGTKDRAGCELRVEVRHSAVAHGDPVVAGRIAACVAELRGPAAAWDIVAVRLMRSRAGYDRQGRWEQSFELRVRCLASGP